MKKMIVALFVLTLLFSGASCLKDDSCQDKTIQSETGAMNGYALANGITATTHSTGLMYEVTVTGTGVTPTIASTVSVKYTGKLLDGTVFDSRTTPISIPLSNTIPGWQIGLQLLQKGGTIKLLIPSSLAYGCRGQGAVPGSAILYFEVELVDVTN